MAVLISVWQAAFSLPSEPQMTFSGRRARREIGEPVGDPVDDEAARMRRGTAGPACSSTTAVSVRS
jgi:hypothetical protein